jgi:hypothetical protein
MDSSFVGQCSNFRSACVWSGGKVGRQIVEDKSSARTQLRIINLFFVAIIHAESALLTKGRVAQLGTVRMVEITPCHATRHAR